MKKKIPSFVGIIFIIGCALLVGSIVWQYNLFLEIDFEQFTAGKKAASECGDHIDNDGDGYCDYTWKKAYCSDGSIIGDAGCYSKFDNDETNCNDNVCEGNETYNNCPADCSCVPSLEICNDNLDNDCDTDTDCDDSECYGYSVCCSNSTQDGDETGIDCGGSCISGIETGSCTGGVDDDKDCLIDCNDPDCSADPVCADGGTTILFDDFETDFIAPGWYDDGIIEKWTRDSAGTSSSSTGPSTGADGTAWYIYVETSSNECYTADETAIVYQTPEINFNSYTGEYITWWNSMYGTNIGTLKLEENTTGFWVELWSENTDQGIPDWVQSTVDLSGLIGTGELRFHYTCAGGFQGDVAIDEIGIYGQSGGACEGTDTHCGIYPSCQECNENDGQCIGAIERDYYCEENTTGCSFITEDCSQTCGCTCEDYGKTNETGFCSDGKDNDCDAKTDCNDPDCSTDVMCAGGIDYTDRSCNVDGSAAPGNVICSGKNEGVNFTDATFDSCTDGTSNYFMHVEDIFIDATTVLTTDTVQVTCDVCCYNSGTEYGILYNSGSGWRNLDYGNCNSGSQSSTCTAIESKTINVPVDDVAGTHYFRCWESWSGCDSTTQCCSSTYADNDDMSITVIAGENCVDSDLENNIYIKGNVNVDETVYEDYCIEGSTELKNIIIFIGDGMGPEHQKAASFYSAGAQDQLFFESNFPYRTSVTTYSANNLTTDSAASATAIATGNKVNSGVVSMAIPGDGSELETLLEYYKAFGKAVGVVTTTYTTHATPAAFGAHEPSRDNYAQIANDYFVSEPNVLLGGGENGISTTAFSNAGYTVVTNLNELNSINTQGIEYLLGEFGSSHMPYEYDGLGSLPHLTDMTNKALDILDNDPDGLFLMVEGGRIDHAGHSNDIVRNIQETLEFDQAVQAAFEWAQNRTDTLIIVTADHETGGLQVLQNNGAGSYPTVSWSTEDHTAANVYAYSWGAGAHIIANVNDNTEFSDAIKSIGETVLDSTCERICGIIGVECLAVDTSCINGCTDGHCIEDSGDSTDVTFQQLKDDITLPHEMSPLPIIPDSWGWSYHGFPYQDACGPRSFPDNGKDYYNPWGQIFPDPSTPTNLNAGFELGAITFYIKLKSTGQWYTYEHGTVNDGYIFYGQSALPEVPGTSWSPIAGPGGGLFYKLGMGGWGQDQGAHFWPSHSHEWIDNPDVEHVVVSITGRIALQDPNGMDDRYLARYLVGIGVDHRAQGGEGPIIEATLMSRHRYLTNEWQTFTAHTICADNVEINSPPIHDRTY